MRYSEAGNEVIKFCEQLNIPFCETQAGKSSCPTSHCLNLGGVGVTGNLSANTIAKQADLVIAVGSRLSDFTTGSKSCFKNPDVDLITINLSQFHAEKLDALSIVGDARANITILNDTLVQCGYKSDYKDEIAQAKKAWSEEMARLCSYSYGKNFEPLVKARNESSIDDFVNQTNGTITQTQALGIIRKEIEEDAIIVGASGSLPGDLQRMWETDAKDSYHMEYGYSCMGYEIAAALGAKMAKPNTQVYSMVGDGSFMMLHSELTTSLQEDKKIIVLLFDNCGFGCINNLQMGQGIDSLATEFRYRTSSNKMDGDFVLTDFSMIAKGYGLAAYTAKTPEELTEALKLSKLDNRSVLIDIKVLPKTMTDGYESWWNVGIASISEGEATQKAYQTKLNNQDKARKY